MENASKALIIAGAILISIVLITLGVIIVGQGQEVVKNSSMSETEVASFNGKFTQFEGQKIRGSKINNLLNVVFQNNMAQEDDGKKVAFEYEGTNTTTQNNVNLKISDTTKPSTKFDTGKMFNVSLEYDDNTGLVNKVIVNDYPSSSSSTTE